MSSPQATTATGDNAAWKQIREQISEIRILPVTSFDNAEQARATAEALMQGGINCIEITFRTAAAYDAIKAVSETEGLLVAAGTILSVQQLQQASDAGAKFGLAPGTNLDVIHAANEIGLPFIPGAATASEVEQLRHIGVRINKVFPYKTVGGNEFLRSLAAVYPEMRFIPTGGIDASNLRESADAPGVLAIGGSWIAPLDLIRAGQFEQIEKNAREARALLT
jgi:2-dehydro-3-deoxyphosphogluconate aldolase / (4S)-4-hydroxy-2-oxoglutarate aldolase